MALRLQFLLQSSGSPAIIATPIQGLVTALQEITGNTMTAQAQETASSLVEMLVNIDRQMGQEQADEDERWQHAHASLADETYMLLQNMEREGSEQDRYGQEIGQLEAEMHEAKQDLVGHEAA